MDRFNESYVVRLQEKRALRAAGPPISFTIPASARDQHSSEETAFTRVFSDPSGVATSATNISEDESVLVPNVLHSKDTFIALGFNNEVAADLYKVHQELLPTQRHEDDILDVACAYIDQEGSDAFDETDNWSGCLIGKLGISAELTAAIMNIEFPEFQYAESASWHCKDAFGMRWRGIQRAINLSWAKADPLSDRPYTYSSGAGTMVRNESEAQRHNEPGTTTIYKCVDTARVQQIFRNNLPSSHFSLTPIISAPPGDFNGRHAHYYLSVSEAGAQHYARYVKFKAGGAGCCIMALTIPDVVISSAVPFIMKSESEIWKKLVWHSRRGMALKGKADEALNREVLIGDTSRGTAKTWEGIPHWSNIGPNNIIMLEDGGPMVQFVFGEDFEGKVHDHCQGKIVLYHDETGAVIPPDNARPGV